MSEFKRLLDTALAGTLRQAPSTPAPAGPVARLQKQIASSALTEPQQLLQRAAVLAVCGQAGFVPAAAANPAPSPAQAERAPAVDHRFAETVLRAVLSDGPVRLQYEAFARLAGSGMRIPYHLLPLALETGRRSVDMRAALTDVIGERGRWLAARNPAWKFAAGASAEADPQQQWDFGTPEQRRAVFIQWRRDDPATARAKLAAELPQLNAKDRAEWLPLLDAQLSPADEPLLDSLLKDRSKEVRQAAAALLTRLPDSRHVKIICGELEPLLRKESGLLGSRLMIEAPSAAAAHWKDEAIDPARPTHESLGERAWWLYQLVRQVPPAWWSRQYGLQPAELLKWSCKTEWTEALQRGWRDAILAAPEPMWCEALLQAWNAKTLGNDPGVVLGLLPLAAREKHWAAQLARGGDKGLPQVLALVLAACPPGQTLSLELSRALAKAMAGPLRSGTANQDYNLRYQLADSLCVLDAAALAPLVPTPRPDSETASQREFADSLARVIDARRALATLSPS